MRYAGSKFHFIFKPFLLISLGVLAFFTLIHFVLFHFWPVLPFDETVFTLLVPFIISLIALLVWYKPRLKRLRHIDYQDNWFHLIVSGALVISLPVIMLQIVLVDITGKVTRLDNIEEIHHRPLSKFYKIQHFEADKQSAKVGFAPATKNRRERGRGPFYHVFTVVPVWNKVPEEKLAAAIPRPARNDSATLIRSKDAVTADRVKQLQKNPPAAWICTYSKVDMGDYHASDGLSVRLEKFRQSVLGEIWETDFHKYDYFEQPANNFSRRGLERLVREVLNNDTTRVLLLEAGYNVNRQNAGRDLFWCAGIFVVVHVAYWFFVRKQELKMTTGSAISL